MHGKSEPILGPEIGEFALVADHAAAQGWGPLRAVAHGGCALPVATPAVQYALSVFEGLKAFRDPAGALHLFRVRDHAERLRRSAQRLCLPDVPVELFVRACAEATTRNATLVPDHGAGSLYLRPTLYGSEEYLGVRTARTHQFAVVTTRAAAQPLRTVRLRAEFDFCRAAPGGTGAAKTGGNYAGALLAQYRAQEAGFDDVLWLDAIHRRDVGEAGTMNVFFVFRDRVVTPALDGTILAGITRDCCITLLRERGLLLEERTIALSELDARVRAGELLEAFGTGTALRLVRIGEIVHPGGAIRPGGGPLPAEGPLIERLSGELAGLQEGSAPDRHGWREPAAAIRMAGAAGASGRR